MYYFMFLSNSKGRQNFWKDFCREQKQYVGITGVKLKLSSYIESSGGVVYAQRRTKTCKAFIVFTEEMVQDGHRVVRWRMATVNFVL